MITVGNHQTYVLKNPNGDKQLTENLIATVTQAIRASQPFIESIHILNKTKHCVVIASILDGKFVVSITNPEDEIFKLEEISE